MRSGTQCPQESVGHGECSVMIELCQSMTMQGEQGGHSLGCPGELEGSPASDVLEPALICSQKLIVKYSGNFQAGGKGYKTTGCSKSVTRGVFTPQKLEISKSYKSGLFVCFFPYVCILAAHHW